MEEYFSTEFLKAKLNLISGILVWACKPTLTLHFLVDKISLTVGSEHIYNTAACILKTPNMETSHICFQFLLYSVVQHSCNQLPKLHCYGITRHDFSPNHVAESTITTCLYTQ